MACDPPACGIYHTPVSWYDLREHLPYIPLGSRTAHADRWHCKCLGCIQSAARLRSLDQPEPEPQRKRSRTVVLSLGDESESEPLSAEDQDLIPISDCVEPLTDADLEAMIE